jgi:hypothetical protein
MTYWLATCATTVIFAQGASLVEELTWTVTLVRSNTWAGATARVGATRAGCAGLTAFGTGLAAFLGTGVLATNRAGAGRPRRAE